MDATGITRISVSAPQLQGRTVERRGVPFTTKRPAAHRLGGLSRAALRDLKCSAAAEPEVASPQEIDAAVAGELATPADPAGQPITGEGSTQPAQNAQPGQPAGGGRQGGESRQRQPRAAREIKYKMADLKVGEWYDGKVVSTQSFGAFFDIGTAKEGLCHISQLSEGFVDNVAKFLAIGDTRKVRVMGVDPAKGRIELSLVESKPTTGGNPAAGRSENGIGPGRGGPARGGAARGGGGRGRGQGRSRGTPALPLPDIKVGQEVTGKVMRIERFGVFVSLKEGTKDVLLPVEGMKDQSARNAKESGYAEGQSITAYVQDIDTQKNTARLSLLTPAEQKQEKTFAKQGASAGSTAGNSASTSLLGAALARAGFAVSKPAEEPKPAKATKQPAKATQSEAEAAQAEAPAAEDVPEVQREAEPEPVAAEASIGDEPGEIEEAQPEPAAAEVPAAEVEKAPVAAEAPAAEYGKVEEVKIEPSAPEALTEEEAPAVQETESQPVAAEVPAVEAPSKVEEAQVKPAAAEASAAQEPVKLEKDDNVPEVANNVQPDPAAVPVASLATDSPQTGAPDVADEPKTEETVSEEPSLLATEDSAATQQPAPADETVAKVSDNGTSISSGAADPVASPADMQPMAEGEAAAAEQATSEEVASQDQVEPAAPAAPAVSNSASSTQVQTAGAGAASASSKRQSSEAGPSTSNGTAAGNISASAVKELRDKTGAGMMDCKKALKETSGNVEAAVDFLRKKGLAGADKKSGRITTEGLIASYIHAGSGLGVLLEVNCETDFVARGEVFKGLCSDLAMQVAAFADVVAVSGNDISQELLDKEREIEMGKEDILSKPEDKRAMIVEGRIAKTKKRMSLLAQPYIKDNDKSVETFIKETIAQLGENISVRRFERFVLGEGIQKKQADLAKDVEEQTRKMQEAAAAKAAEPKEEAAPAEPTAEQVANLQVSAKVVKELRQASGAGMMDCKRALAACDGDLDKAADYLRKKGLASADKKAGRVASEGAVASYIHGGRLGVLVEVNCETDFVARGDVFQTLAADMAMQLASNEQVVAISKEDFPPEELERERRIAMEMEDIKSKPENIRQKIVDGRVGKIAAERALLEQPFIKDTKKTVGQHVKETIAALGENITVRRFVRYNLGEGLQKKTDNFAEEVAKATGQQ